MIKLKHLLTEQMDMFGSGSEKDASGNEYSIVEKNGKFSVHVKKPAGEELDAIAMFGRNHDLSKPFSSKAEAAKAIMDYIRYSAKKAQAKKYTKSLTKQFTRENHD